MLPDKFMVWDKSKEKKLRLANSLTEGSYKLTFMSGTSMNVSIDFVEDKLSSGCWEIIEGSNYTETGRRIGELVQSKNTQYGDSFHKSGEFLKILYPNGITTDQYGDMLAVVRIFDKLMRVANGNQGNENAFDDIAGYAILKSGKGSE